VKASKRKEEEEENIIQGQFVNVQAMKAYRKSRGIAPPFLNSELDGVNG
jgi:hypothetical protein